jgi:MFS family permease
MTETARGDGVPTGTSDEPTRLGAAYYKLFSASTISNLGDGIGTIAYLWLASALTRNGLLIGLVGVAQRLPWLLFSLPAGVITDRFSRRKLMIWSNTARAVITFAITAAVWMRQSTLPDPDALAGGAEATEDYALFAVVLLAVLLLGSAEVLYDNSAQTFMPAIVDPNNLEKGNGRLWSAELVANTIAGPPLGALLLVIAFAFPFLIDAGTFALSAVLIASIAPASMRRADGASAAKMKAQATNWRQDLMEGVRWLWDHPLLRPMAIILGLLNMIGTLTFAVLVLFAQEVLETSTTEFAIMGTGGALGGTVGGWVAPRISKAIGEGPSLWATLIGGGVTTLIIGLSSWWPIVWFMFAVFMLLAVLWNVITVSLRQTIIPDHLLGRVNSVYRFFAWGMMPIGAALGGAIIVVTEPLAGRELALRMPWFVAAAVHLVLFAFAAPKLTTANIRAARAEADHGGQNTSV